MTEEKHSDTDLHVVTNRDGSSPFIGSQPPVGQRIRRTFIVQLNFGQLSMWERGDALSQSQVQGLEIENKQLKERLAAANQGGIADHESGDDFKSWHELVTQVVEDTGTIQSLSSVVSALKETRRLAKIPGQMLADVATHKGSPDTQGIMQAGRDHTAALNRLDQALIEHEQRLPQ